MCKINMYVAKIRITLSNCVIQYFNTERTVGPITIDPSLSCILFLAQKVCHFLGTKYFVFWTYSPKSIYTYWSYAYLNLFYTKTFLFWFSFFSEILWHLPFRSIYTFHLILKYNELSGEGNKNKWNKML